MAAVTMEAAHSRAELLHQPRSNKLGLWIFMASETFLFSALISARFITSGVQKPEDLNQALAFGLTCVLLVSSISACLAEAFIATGHLREALHNFPPGTIYGTAFFSLIGLHPFHVLTGVLGLAVVLNLGAIGHFGPANSWPVEGVVKYWHFVDLMWVIIYPALYLF